MSAQNFEGVEYCEHAGACYECYNLETKVQIIEQML